MVIIKINGINGYLFNIDITAKKKWLNEYGMKKYYLVDFIKGDIAKHFKKEIEKQIHKEYNVKLDEANDEELYKIEDTALVKNWLNFTNLKYIKLMKDNIILDNENFNDDELKDGDIINYIIEPRKD